MGLLARATTRGFWPTLRPRYPRAVRPTDEDTIELISMIEVHDPDNTGHYQHLNRHDQPLIRTRTVRPKKQRKRNILSFMGNSAATLLCIRTTTERNRSTDDFSDRAVNPITPESVFDISVLAIPG